MRSHCLRCLGSLLPALSLAVLCLAVLVCCPRFGLALGKAEAPTGASTGELRLEAQAGDYALTLRSPGKPGMAQALLLVQDAAGKAVSGLSITGLLDMPTMDMRPAYPMEMAFAPTEAGQYTALAQYPHGGLWRIRLKLAAPLGKVWEHAFTFTIENHGK
jgi:hypothetical protein